MKKRVGAVLACVTLMATATTHVAALVEVDLPGGTALTVHIASPLAGAVLQSGSPLIISGEATVQEAPAVKNTDLVFVLDTSGSTNDSSGLACGTVLNCEKLAVQQLVQQATALRSPINSVSVVAFPNTSTVGPVDPGDAAINAYLSTLGSSGTTDFSAGISRARPLLAASDGEEKLIVLLTDGDGTTSPNEPAIPAVVSAFTIGGQQCTPALNAILVISQPGSSCSAVSDLGQLSSVIQNTIGSSIESVTVTVDDQQVYADTTVIPGPASTSFTTTANGLAAGPHTVCATATGRDALGSGFAEECADVVVLAPGAVIVDCGVGAGECVGTAQDPGKSNLTFRAPPEFDETVTLVPNSGTATACAGQPCTTGYDVLFPSTTGNGPVVSLTVLTTQKVSVRDRLQAAVYIDDVRITAQCSNRTILKLVRDALGRPEPIPCITITYKPTGQLEYFVKFNSDPGVRFR